MSFNEAVTRVGASTRQAALTPGRLIVGGILLAEIAWVLAIAVVVLAVLR